MVDIVGDPQRNMEGQCFSKANRTTGITGAGVVRRKGYSIIVRPTNAKVITKTFRRLVVCRRTQLSLAEKKCGEQRRESGWNKNPKVCRSIKTAVLSQGGHDSLRLAK